MSEFKSEEIGNFGVPGVEIEQTLLESYDPYSGIDLRDEVINQNVCIGLEGSRAPDNVDILDPNIGGTYNFPDNNGLNDGLFRSLDNELWPNYIRDYFTEGCQTELNFSANELFEVRAVCADGSMVLLGNSYGDRTIDTSNWFYDSGEQACLQTMKQYSNLYFSSDNDKRQSLGLFTITELNETEDNFTDNIPNLLFTQIPKINFLTNGSGRLVRENNYETGSLGNNSYKPLGDWTYLGLDGVGIHLTTNETTPSSTPVKYIQSDEFQIEDNSTYGYAGWAPYIYPFEDGTNPNHYLNFFDTPPIETNHQWATWVRSDECFSFGKCLKFETDENYGDDINIQTKGLLDLIESNEYRTNNQAQKIYDSFNPNTSVGDITLNPYTSLEVSFKMKTKRAGSISNDTADLNNAFVESSILRAINLDRPRNVDSIFEVDENLFNLETDASLDAEEQTLTTTYQMPYLQESYYSYNETFNNFDASESGKTIPSAAEALVDAYGGTEDNYLGYYLRSVKLKAVRLAGDFDQSGEYVELLNIGGNYLQAYQPGGEFYMDYLGTSVYDPSNNRVYINYDQNPVVTTQGGSYSNSEQNTARQNFNDFNAALLVWTPEDANHLDHEIHMYYSNQNSGTEDDNNDEQGFGVIHKPITSEVSKWEYELLNEIQLRAASSGDGIGLYLELELEYSSNFYQQIQVENILSNVQKFYETNYTDPRAAYNSITSNGSTGEKLFGTVNRFKNTKINEWEEFKYTFNLIDEHNITDDILNIEDLNFVIQTSSDEDNNGFNNSLVYIDDIEVKESYNFTPDVDVRKKKGPNDYGIADLTKYYDKDLEPEMYADTTAPLEVQFYFYPRYYYNDVFISGAEKPIIHNDFRNNMFYIYDVDWGDGTPKEFTSEPALINEETSLYHTYETNGIFEITGTMIRMKPDKEYNPTGIIHHKKFQLFININEELDEDFLYFGTEGFSFIPFRNTLPVIGGYNEQSIYYKSIKRQLGLIEDEDADRFTLDVDTKFKSVGDRLKTEIALDKMDSSFSNKFNILNEYKKQRTIENGDTIYNGIKTNSEELGKAIGDVDITNIRYFNTGSKSIWEMIGFEDEVNPTEGHPGNPESLMYWEKIIPKNYSIFEREGIISTADGYIISNYINQSEQNWYDSNLYYPVLPKYSSDGKFIFNTYPENKIRFPQNGPITNEAYTDDSLRISITTQTVEPNVFNDKSGNNNYGFSFTDYKPEFNQETLKPKKVKSTGNTRVSKFRGAF